MTSLPGVSGTLLPDRFLVERVSELQGDPIRTEAMRVLRGRLRGWWTAVAATCGPTTAIRTLFDLVAMPLMGMLGFKAASATIDARSARVCLRTRGGSTLVLLVLPWATTPSSIWREVVVAARDVGAEWGLILAPPFLTMIDTRGHARRRHLDFCLPEVIEGRGFGALWMVVRADAHDEHHKAARAPHDKASPGSSLHALVDAGAKYQGVVRADLQHGVHRALRTLVSVLEGPSACDEALTIVYRVLFLLFAESRQMLPMTDAVFRDSYAISTLCREASERRDSPGLWEALAAITRLARRGCRSQHLMVAPFNGRLFSRVAAPSLESTTAGSGHRHRRLRDLALRDALVALGSRPTRYGRETIAYRDLGVEQLGAVYERVLDLAPGMTVETRDAPVRTRDVSIHGRDASAGARGVPDRPHVLSDSRRASSRGTHSTDRKQTGTFYTPQSLAEFVVRRTLSPLVAGRSPDDILSLRVLDPAMGSGAFLVAACHFLASAYERSLIDAGGTSATDFDDDVRARIRRTVAERCLAGVDRNPAAVQVARLSLWLCTLAHGKPLTFLDHQLRVGDSLIGASPDDLHRTPTSTSRKQTQDNSTALPFEDDLSTRLREVAETRRTITCATSDTVEQVRKKEHAWEQLVSERSPVAAWKLATTTWCSRWFWPEGQPPSGPELRAAIDAILRGDRSLRPEHLHPMLRTARETGERLRFFHWPLEFADVFYDSAGAPRRGAGFDAIIGNPPWEMLRNDDQSFESAAPVPRARPAAADARRRSDRHHRPLARSLTQFVRESGLYRSCGRGHVNLFQPFVERTLDLVKPGGRLGLVLPWSVATDDGNAALRRRLLDDTSVDAIVGIENTRGMFPIHRGLRFAAITATAGRRTDTVRMRCGVSSEEVLDALPASNVEVDDAFPICVDRADLSAIGGGMGRIPYLRGHTDLSLARHLSAAFPPIGSAAGWQARFGRELNATEAASSFGFEGLPVIQGRDIEPFRLIEGEERVDNRDPIEGAERVDGTEPFDVRPVGQAHRPRISLERAAALRPDRAFERPRLAYRDVSGASNRLSLVAAIVPSNVVTTHTLFCLRGRLPIEQQHFLAALFNSFVLNYLVRMLMGGHVTTTLVESLPAPPWRRSREQRLVAALARHAAHPARSAAVREPSPEAPRLAHPAGARLQAEVAHMFNLDRGGLAHILETFPLVPREERTRVLLVFDALQRRPGSRRTRQEDST